MTEYVRPNEFSIRIGVELAKTDNTNRARKKLSQQRNAIGHKVSSSRTLQDLAVRHYALLSELESIEQSLKQKSLSRVKYIKERAQAMDRIAHVELLRLREVRTNDITYFLDEIADEPASLENAVWLKPR
jgi:hypothetical protein